MRQGARSAMLSPLLLLVATIGRAQEAANPGQGAPAAAPAASACGSQPSCMDTPIFAAAITEFRVTVAQNGFKVIDATVRFQNKTSEQLILGYVNGSGLALDDQGNRYAPNPYANAYRGIGLVSGNAMDPKFVLRPGSWGDARFELLWRPGAQDPIGSRFELALSVSEITTLPGNQHALGGEYPLRFQGLADGAGGGGPTVVPVASGVTKALASGGVTPAPCAGGVAGTVAGLAGSAGAQPPAAVSNAAATVSNIRSLFGHKKQAANAASANAAAAPGATANGAAPCAPAPAAAAPMTPAANSAVAAPVPAPAAAAAAVAPVAAPAAAGPAVSPSAALTSAAGPGASAAITGQAAPAPKPGRAAAKPAGPPAKKAAHPAPEPKKST